MEREYNEKSKIHEIKLTKKIGMKELKILKTQVKKHQKEIKSEFLKESSNFFVVSHQRNHRRELKRYLVGLMLFPFFMISFLCI